jgi:hypothetical protein
MLVLSKAARIVADSAAATDGCDQRAILEKILRFWKPTNGVKYN